MHRKLSIQQTRAMLDSKISLTDKQQNIDKQTNKQDINKVIQ